MKKIILSAVVIFAFGFTNAQTVKFGVKGGVNLANLTGDVQDASMKVGFHAGGLAEIKIAENFAIQPELQFSLEGSKTTDRNSGTGFSRTSEDDLSLTYVNLPVMFKYYILTDKLSLEAGPQVGFLASAKRKFDTTTNTGGTIVRTSGSDDVKDQFNSVNFGFNAGAGYNFTEHIFTSIRYNLGLADISKNDSNNNSKINNVVVQFSLGYKF